MSSDIEVSRIWSFALIAMSFYCCSFVIAWLSKVKAPVVGVKSKFEIGFVSNFRFYKNAEAILVEGYTRVAFSRS